MPSVPKLVTPNEFDAYSSTVVYFGAMDGLKKSFQKIQQIQSIYGGLSGVKQIKQR